MSHTPLITTIVASIGLAFILGAIANRLRIPPLVGYLLAGVVIGPATPGYVADTKLAPELAEIGVILLMFGVGLHFSLKDLLSVSRIAVPGAVAQIAAATLLGMALAWFMDWPLSAGFVFGLALSTASTVVLLRAVQERRLIETMRGRIAVGWLIVEDIVMVLALVLLPALAGIIAGNGADGGSPTRSVAGDSILTALAMTVGKIVAFIALMLVVGRRVIPWILHTIAHTGSRELFRLAVFAVALGVAFGAAQLFGVSFALGAFFAGMIMSESVLSQRAAEEAMPLRDAFAVLFFVSVGMLFDPAILVTNPLPVIATVLIIIFGKSVAAFFIVAAFGQPKHTALTISASLAQIGEFSFILAALGVSLGMLPREGQDLILAGSILSILANPICFALLDRFKPAAGPGSEVAVSKEAVAGKEHEPGEQLAPTQLTNHAVLVGYGRVGSLIGAALERERVPFLVIETNHELLEPLRARNVETIAGNAAQGEILAAANIAEARWLLVAIPDAFEGGQIVEQARAANPKLFIIARAHADAEEEHLRRFGAEVVLMGEREIARGMIQAIFANQANTV